MKQAVSKKTLQELADFLGAELRGDPCLEIHTLATLQEAGPGSLSFLVNPSYRKFLAETEASAVIISPKDISVCPVSALITPDPRLALARVAKLFAKAMEV